MKILVVTPHFYPAIGGLESYVLSVVRGMKARGHQVVVVTSSEAHDVVTHDVFEGSSVYYLPVQLRISNTPVSLRWRRQLKRIIRHEAPDVINTHAPVPFMADIATFAAGTIPVVATYHAGSLLKGTGGLVDTVLRMYERFVLPRVLRRARHVAAVYPAFVERILGDDADKVTFAPPGIDTEFFAPAKADKAIDLTFVGRVERTSEWKGIDVLLKAVRILHGTRPLLNVHIVGQGDAIPHYRAMARKLGIHSLVTFTGSQKGEELRQTYRQSRIVVLPSKTEAESFGMVLAEAGSCGVATVGSRIGGIPNVIDDGVTGLLAEPNSPESLAASIAQLLDNPQLQTMYGQAAHQRISTMYSQQRLLDTYEYLFQRAGKQRHPKLVHVTAHFPPALGGMERVAENLAHELAERGQQVEVVTTNIGYEPSRADEQEQGYKVTRLAGRMIANVPVAPSLFWHLLQQPRGSLYHVHIAQAGFPEMTILAAWLRGGKVIGHFHLDVAASGRFGAIFKLYKLTIFPWILRRMHAVIVFSREQKHLVTTKYRVAEQRTHIVPNGVSENYFYQAERAPHAPLRLLFVGRLSPQKNLPLLLTALQGVSQQFDTTIVGAGENEADLRLLAKRAKLQNVHFAGRKDGEALLEAYESADVFVLPSEREGMPLVLLEAMAMRLPIVGTNVLGTRDLVRDGHNGYLVPLGDPAQLQAALLNIANDAETYTRMSKRAGERATQYSWQKLAEHILREVYA